MSESPIFVKTYDLVRWLVPTTTRFSRDYRFGLALPMQEQVYAFQRCLVSAAKAVDRRVVAQHLIQADVELTLLRYKVRLSRDLNLLKPNGYEHVSRLIDEVGRLLGGWMKKQGISGAQAP
jgi:hypothetical protein